MFVRCPNCHTKYKVSEEILRGSVAAFRCSRCKHTFEHAATETPQNTAATANGRELSFGFAPSENLDEKGLNPDASASAGALSHSGNSVMPSDSAEHWSLTVTDLEPEKPFTISADEDLPNEDSHAQPEHGAPRPRDAAPALGATEKVLPFDPYRDQPASTKPFLTLFGLLIIFFSSVTALHQAHPTTSEQIVKNIPLVGPAVLKNDHLKHGVALQSISGHYQTIQGNREVFIVTGSAHNENSVVVREVQIAGRIFDHDGKRVDQQTIWVGNAISSKIIRGMTAQDIVDLQRLAPLKTFSIPPGDSVPFAIVFMKTIKGIKDFTCEVLSAEGEL